MKKIFLLMLLLFPVSVAAQTAAFNGYCTLGSTPAITSGLPSSNLNQGLIPQCQVSVYLTGTVNLASIYADATNTPLTNPFTASTKAQWLFFAATGQGYDVVMNGGFPPLVYTVPVTLTDLSVPTGGGSAGCTTSGIAGTLVASNGTGGCQPAQVEVNSAPLATPSPINFTNTPSITVANPGTGVIQLTGAALKTDGSANSLQNLLNFIDTSTIQFTNPSGGIESATCVTSTVSVIGCMKPDGTTISISSGIITAITATSSTLGIVKPDNTTVTISGGVLSAAPQSALIIQAEDVTLGGKFAAGSGQTLDFNSTLPAPPGGNLNVTFQNDPATGRLSAYVPSTATPAIQPVIISPISGQYVILYPTTITTCSNTEPGRGTIGCAAGSTGLVNGSSPSLEMILNKFPSSFPPIDMSGTLSGFSLPSYINPANVTAVYGFAVTEMQNPSGPGLQPSYCGVSGNSVLPSGGITNWSARQVNVLTGLVGSTISTASCHFEWVNSGADPLGVSIFGVQAMGLIVYFNGTAPPVNNNLLVQWPLTVNYATNSPNATLSIDPLFPYWTNVLKVSDLGVQANTGPYTITPIRDGATTTDCSAGGGANFVLCTSTDGVTYTALGTGGGLVTSVGNSDGTLTISPTTGSVVASLNLGHANTWTQNQTFNQGIDLDGTGSPFELGTDPGTIGQCVISGGAATTPHWANCGSGSPVAGSGTGGYYSLWQGSGASVTLGNGHVDDSVTHAGIITSTLPVELTTSHDGGTLIFDEAFPFSPASGKDILYGDSASHCLMYSANGGSFACLGSGGGSGTVTDSSGTTTANQLALSTTTTHQIQYSTAIPNGTTATTQTAGDNTTKVATDAFVLANGGTSSYTNVVASSSADTTVALINAKCTGGQTYIASIPLSIATGGTINSGCNVSHWAGGVWTIASGQTVTFTSAIRENGAPTQFFAGSGAAVLAPQNVSIEWWAGVDDGAPSPNTGTDNTAAWTAMYAAIHANHASAWLMECGAYAFATTGPAIVDSGISIIGKCPGGYGVTTGPISTIFSKDTAATIVSVTGAGTGGSRIVQNTLSNFAITRGAVATTTAIALQVHFALNISENNVTVTDAGLVDIEDSPSFLAGGFVNNDVLYGYGSHIASSGTYTCYALHGGSGFGFNSTVFTTNGCGKQNTFVPVVIGASVDGTIQDLNFDAPGTAFVDKPLILNGTIGQDVWVHAPTYDNCAIECIYIHIPSAKDVHILGNGPSGWLTIVGGSQTAGIEVDTTPNVSVEGFMFHGTANHPSIYVHGTVLGGDSFKNNTFTLSSGQAISCSGTNGVQFNNNFIDGLSNNFTSPIIQYANCSFGQIMSNVITDGSVSGLGAGIGLDASSNNNVYANLNTNLLGLSDAGTGNEFASGVAWGAITGTLSAQTDLNTALGLKAPLASPTFTGTPDASGATQFKLPVGASFTAAANGELGQATTTDNWHIWANGADRILAWIPTSGITNGDCTQFSLSSGILSLADAGGACGIAGGGGPPTGSAGGDLSGTYPNPGVAKVNGASLPISASSLATNGSGQIIAGSGSSTSTCTAPAITTTVTGSPAATMTVSGIASTGCNSLRIVLGGQSNTGSCCATGTFQANGDSTAGHYTFSYYTDTGTANSHASVTNGTAANMGQIGNGTTSQFGIDRCEIANYASTSADKPYECTANAQAATGGQITITGGRYTVTGSAITSLVFGPSGGSWEVGSYVTVTPEQ